MILVLRRPRAEHWREHSALAITRLMVLLTFGTGVVDAASYLGLHKVFTANMTGNVVFIGLGLAGHDDLPILRSLMALVGFLLGALIAGRYQRAVPIGLRCPTRTVHLFGTVAVLLAVLTVTFAFWHPGAHGLDAVTAVFGLAMGMQAGAARRLAVTDVSTVVVTSAIVSLAADSRFGGRNRNRQLRRLGAGAAMCLGALVGALLLKIHLTVPLALATLIAVAVTYSLAMLSRAELAVQATSVSRPGSPDLLS